MTSKESMPFLYLNTKEAQSTLQIPAINANTCRSYDIAESIDNHIRTKGVGDLEAVAGGPAIVALCRLADSAVLVAYVEHAAIGGVRRRRGRYERRETNG